MQRKIYSLTNQTLINGNNIAPNNVHKIFENIKLTFEKGATKWLKILKNSIKMNSL